jgi:transcriptional regulator with XRE-family HTH domain
MKKATDKISQTDIELCSDDDVLSEPNEPELATNEEWRDIMIKARKARGWSQDVLADKVGLSQPQISNIESGEASGSSYVMRICRVLGIAPPEHFVDEFDRTWQRLGRTIRYYDREQADNLRELIESMVAKFERDLPEYPRKIDPKKK